MLPVAKKKSDKHEQCGEYGWLLCGIFEWLKLVTRNIDVNFEVYKR